MRRALLVIVVMLAITGLAGNGRVAAQEGPQFGRSQRGRDR